MVGPAFPWGKGGEIWADLVRERTKGRINIKMYPGAALVGGDQTREFTAVRQGAIDLAIGSTINWSPQIKELNLYSMPFLALDHAGIDALTTGEVGKEMFALVEKAGVVPLAWGENGFREVTNSKREIRKPDDMKGLKFRVVGSPIFNDTFTALGANPTQMSWADAQPALASGAVDGQENPLHIFTAAKLNTVGQKHVTLWGYLADPLIFVVNKEVWDSWTPEDREIVRQAAIDAGKQEIALARKGLTGDRRRDVQGGRRARRHRDAPDAGREGRLRQGDAPGLREVDADGRAGPRQEGRGRRRRAQEVTPRPPSDGAGRGAVGPGRGDWPSRHVRRRPRRRRGPAADRHRSRGGHRRDRHGAGVPHHLRQRAGALFHQRVVRVHRGVLGLPAGRDDARRRVGGVRAQPPHPDGVLRRQARPRRPARGSRCW